MDKIIFTDRYGGNYPDIGTMCKGDCDGMGLVPVKRHDPEYSVKWEEAEKINPNPANDEWHFVKCNQCNGTGKKITAD